MKNEEIGEDMSTEELIKEANEEKFKEQIGLIRFRLIESMGYLDLADDDRTLALYSKLDRALVEVLALQKVLNG